MNYEEALALKKSLKSDRFISASGNVLHIVIVPETEQYLNAYKAKLITFWVNGSFEDKYAKLFAKDHQYTLYGIRCYNYCKFSGGKLILSDHPELVI